MINLVGLISQFFCNRILIYVGLIPCGHTYCTKCLNELCAGSDTIICPECRREHDVPAAGVTAFLRNLSYQQLLDIRTEQLVSTRQCQVEYSARLIGEIDDLHRSAIKNVHSPIVFIATKLFVLIVKNYIVMN